MSLTQEPPAFRHGECQYETKIRQLQQRAVAAGLGDWEERVIVPAKTEQVFKFKNEDPEKDLAEKP